MSEYSEMISQSAIDALRAENEQLKAEAEANQQKIDDWDIASQLPGVDVPTSDKLGISRLVEINHALRGDAEIARIEHQRLTAERDAALAKLAQAREALKKADSAFEQIHDEWAGPGSWDGAAMGQVAAVCIAASSSIDAALAAIDTEQPAQGGEKG